MVPDTFFRRQLRPMDVQHGIAAGEVMRTAVFEVDHEPAVLSPQLESGQIFIAALGEIQLVAFDIFRFDVHGQRKSGPLTGFCR